MPVSSHKSPQTPAESPLSPPYSALSAPKSPPLGSPTVVPAAGVSKNLSNSKRLCLHSLQEGLSPFGGESRRQRAAFLRNFYCHCPEQQRIDRYFMSDFAAVKIFRV